MQRSTLVPAALRYLEQVARSGSIQRAARELNVAASAIDRQILKLEDRPRRARCSSGCRAACG